MANPSVRKNVTKSKILNYIMNNKAASKAELAKNLNLSMPTVLTNVNELLEKGIIAETGEYASTGGRKAKSIEINPMYRCAMGIVITANHVGMVLVNLKYEIEKEERVRLKFSADMSYCTELSQLAEKFLKDTNYPKKLLGIGISIPGIIHQKEHFVIKSHALQLENYSLNFLEQSFPYPVHFENDANAAMMAEDLHKYNNAIYLSLNHTLGGAFCIDGKLFSGLNQKAGEFGHMILVPNGRKCYCGKLGCADAYCAASVLTDYTIYLTFLHIGKLGILRQPNQINGPYGAVSLLGNYDFRNIFIRRIFVVIIVTVNKHYHIRILLNRS